MSGYFLVLPEFCAKDHRLNAGAKLLYCQLLRLIDENKFGIFTNKYLSELLNKSPSQIKRYLVNLINCGYIVIEVKDRNTRHIWIAKKLLQENRRAEN